MSLWKLPLDMLRKGGGSAPVRFVRRTVAQTTGKRNERSGLNLNEGVITACLLPCRDRARRAIDKAPTPSYLSANSPVSVRQAPQNMFRFFALGTWYGSY